MGRGSLQEGRPVQCFPSVGKLARVKANSERITTSAKGSVAAEKDGATRATRAKDGKQARVVAEINKKKLAKLAKLVRVLAETIQAKTARVVAAT